MTNPAGDVRAREKEIAHEVYRDLASILNAQVFRRTDDVDHLAILFMAMGITSAWAFLNLCASKADAHKCAEAMLKTIHEQIDLREPTDGN